MDGGEALYLNWHADDGGLTDYRGFFETRIGEIS